MGNHVTHISIKSPQLVCKDSDTLLVTLLAHCSHYLQLLDVSMYAPFKYTYNMAVKDWMINNAETRMAIYDAGGLNDKAFPKSFAQTNILSGFKKTGIYLCLIIIVLTIPFFLSSTFIFL